MVKRGLSILVFMLLSTFVSWAQDDLPQAWHDYLELLAEDGDDEAVEDLLDLYAECVEHKVNVNDTAQGLHRFPFITTFQHNCLRSYIVMFGPLSSLAELRVVNGFDSLTLELLRPLAYCGPMPIDDRLRLKDVLSKGRSNLVMGAVGTVEQAQGYQTDKYEGNNLRLMWRYQYKYRDRVSLLLSGDKDPGEAFFAGSHRQGFDFYGYSLLVNDIGPKTAGRYLVKRLALGQYQLQFGQGLTLWSGYGPRYGVGTAICRSAQGIRANGAFAEYGYLQGAAATLSVSRNWDLSLFYSFADRAATLPRGADPTSNVVQSVYSSGYFRTDSELSKKGLLNEQMAGMHLERHTTNSHIGLTATTLWLDKLIVPAPTAYNDNAFAGNRNSNVGADFAFRRGRLLLFGEAAVCVHPFDGESLHVAPVALVGSELAVNNSHRLSAQLHYYSPWYHNLHASAIGQGSSPQNDLGAALYYQGRLPWGVETQLSADYFFSPHARYMAYAPSRGQEYRAVVCRSSGKVSGLSYHLRYRFKERGRNVVPTALSGGSYVLEQTYRHQLMVDVTYEHGPWKWVSKVGYAAYWGQESPFSDGWLCYQDMVFAPQRVPLSLSARLAWFDVEDYEARLYAIESDLLYHYNNNMYQNQGIRAYLVLRYDVSRHWNIGFKYSITNYTDRDTFGSGYELIDASHRQQWRIQMRWKW